jgi:hypothetical protein
MGRSPSLTTQLVVNFTRGLPAFGSRVFHCQGADQIVAAPAGAALTVTRRTRREAAPDPRPRGGRARPDRFDGTPDSVTRGSALFVGIASHPARHPPQRARIRRRARPLRHRNIIANLATGAPSTSRAKWATCSRQRVLAMRGQFPRRRCYAGFGQLDQRANLARDYASLANTLERG